MAFNEHLGERIATNLQRRGVQYEAKKMFGGLCYLVDGKMCVGVVKDQLMARMDPEQSQAQMERDGVGPMEFTGRPMKGYLFIEAEAYDLEADLDHWIQQCLDFNPHAKASKTKGQKSNWRRALERHNSFQIRSLLVTFNDTFCIQHQFFGWNRKVFPIPALVDFHLSLTTKESLHKG